MTNVVFVDLLTSCGGGGKPNLVISDELINNVQLRFVRHQARLNQYVHFCIPFRDFLPNNKNFYFCCPCPVYMTHRVTKHILEPNECYLV